MPYLGSGFYVDVVGVILKPVPRKTTVYRGDGACLDKWLGDYHSIVRVTSTNTKKSWIPDLSGAQFVIYQTL
jgi:hypothetical protein